MLPLSPDYELPALPIGDSADGALAVIDDGEATGRSRYKSATPQLTTGSPSVDEADVSLQTKISVFHQRRQKDKSRMFRNVMLFSLVLVVTGVLGSVTARSLRDMWGRTNVALAAFQVLSLNINSWAVVAFASTLSGELDIDAFVRTRPRIITAAWAPMVLNSAYRVTTGAYLSAVEAPIAVGAAVYCWDRICPTWWPLMSTWVVMWFISDFVSSGSSRLPPFYDSDDPDETTVPAAIMGIGCLYVLIGAAIFSAWLWARGPPERCSPTLLVYTLCILWFGVKGLQDVLHGLASIALPAQGSPDYFSATVLVLRGAGMLLPVLVILLLGRQRLFNRLAQLFDGNATRLQRDGAFVAELLDMVPVRKGQAWWVHREEPEESFQPSDPRRNWRRGVVAEVEVGSSEFVVQLPPSEAAHVARRVQVQLASSPGTTREEILQQAQADLRCLEFEKLSADLMKTQDSRNKPELQAEWYALSRPVRPGERIDYFMSHSWHDDATVKWEMIQKVAERFRARVGRYPTFWLDKVCIDQAAVSDGLKVLPVNVMACAKVLLLCGATYPSRLWCVWELFTLYAFTNEATARERLECVFLGNFDQGKVICNQMRRFHVRHAHCYDPNEEARLRRVISAVGTDSFDQRICHVAQFFEVDQHWSSSSRLAALTKWAVGGNQASPGPERPSPP